MGILDPLFTAVTWVILRIHEGLTLLGLDPDGGATWVLSILLLTICVRLVLFPLFVKQIKSSRKMQELQPKMQELRRKYKNDKQRQQQETMKLMQESGANPLGGCLPMLVQLPVFLSLFRVLISIAQDRPQPDWGLTAAVVHSASSAQLFGVSITDRFLNSRLAPYTDTQALFEIAADSSTTSIVVAMLLVLLSSTTMFLTMRHSMRNSAMQQASAGDEMAQKQQQMQKMLLFMAPFFGIFTLWLPIGVLLYIVTSNVWTLAQNFYIYRRYPVAAAAGGAAGQSDTPAKAPTGPAPSSNGSGGKAGGNIPGRRQRPAPEPEPAPAPQQVVRKQPTNKPRSKRSGGSKR